MNLPEIFGKFVGPPIRPHSSAICPFIVTQVQPKTFFKIGLQLLILQFLHW